MKDTGFLDEMSGETTERMMAMTAEQLMEKINEAGEGTQQMLHAFCGMPHEYTEIAVMGGGTAMVQMPPPERFTYLHLDGALCMVRCGERIGVSAHAELDARSKMLAEDPTAYIQWAIARVQYDAYECRAWMMDALLDQARWYGSTTLLSRGGEPISHTHYGISGVDAMEAIGNAADTVREHNLGGLIAIGRQKWFDRIELAQSRPSYVVKALRAGGFTYLGDAHGVPVLDAGVITPYSNIVVVSLERPPLAYRMDCPLHQANLIVYAAEDGWPEEFVRWKAKAIATNAGAGAVTAPVLRQQHDAAVDDNLVSE